MASEHHHLTTIYNILYSLFVTIMATLTIHRKYMRMYVLFVITIAT